MKKLFSNTLTKTINYPNTINIFILYMLFANYWIICKKHVQTIMKYILNSKNIFTKQMICILVQKYFYWAHNVINKVNIMHKHIVCIISFFSYYYHKCCFYYLKSKFCTYHTHLFFFFHLPCSCYMYFA